MSFAIFKVMILGLLRDRGTLVMSFVLPPLIYVIFASIFAGATGAAVQLRVALLDEVNNRVTQRLVVAIRNDPALRRSARDPVSMSDVEDLVRHDQADVGVILRADPSQISKERRASPIIVYDDASKAMASALVACEIQRIFGEKLPDAAYRRVLADFEVAIMPFTPEQRNKADGILDFVARSTQADASPALKEAVAQRATPPLVKQVSLLAPPRAGAAVVYYAGAVAILFLLYSAMHGAMSLIDERQNGIIDRILQGPGGTGPILAGKFLFLLLQGIVQASLIFGLAAMLYGVGDAGMLLRWSLITGAASAASASLGLALAAGCRTRQQAQTLSTFLVLVLAALGGSMVPRFLMPPWLQDLSWAIPNAWVIEAYQRLLWRDASGVELAPLIGALLVFGVTMLALAWAMMRTPERTR